MLKVTFLLPSPLLMLKVFNHCRLCVEHVEEVAKESAPFVHDERPEQIFVDMTEEVEASSKH